MYLSAVLNVLSTSGSHCGHKTNTHTHIDLLCLYCSDLTAVVWTVLTYTIMLGEKNPTVMDAFIQGKLKVPCPLLPSLLISYRMATATITAAVAPSSVCPSQLRQAVPCQYPPPSHPAQPACPPTTETTATASAAHPGLLRPHPVP